MATNPEKPVAFISYSSEDDSQVTVLADDLRPLGILVYTVPFDIDTAGQTLSRLIHRDTSQSKVLIFAATLAGLTSNWLTRTLPAVLEEIEPALSDLFVVQLIDLADRPFPAYLNAYPAEDLSGANYRPGLERLARKIGSAATPVEEVEDDVPIHVSGIFETARSQSSMFEDLRRQINEGKIDQKYLYWDVRASLRWQKIVGSSTYMTAQRGVNVLADNIDAIIADVTENSTGQKHSFINFGVGTGNKDSTILEGLLRSTSSPVLYFPIDESLSMIQITIQSVQGMMTRFPRRLQMHYILDDFRNIDRVKQYIGQTEGRRGRITRILGYLGGSLGNFEERDILSKMRGLMGRKDFLILGTEYVGGRDENALIANYSDIVMKDFLYGPISDVEGKPPKWDEYFNYEVKPPGPGYSSIEGAQTVVGSVSHKDKLIELFYATKYEPEPLEEFLRKAGFEIVNVYTSTDNPISYGKYILQAG